MRATPLVRSDAFRTRVAIVTYQPLFPGVPEAAAVDTTKPVSTAAASGTPGNNGWYVTIATLVLNASDLTSGVARISYRVDGGPWQTYSVPFVLGEGVHLVEYNATDNAGLTETTNSLTVKV